MKTLRLTRRAYNGMRMTTKGVMTDKELIQYINSTFRLIDEIVALDIY